MHPKTLLRLLSIVCLCCALPLLVLAQDSTPEPSAEPDLTPPTQGAFDPQSIAEIDLTTYPILPEMTAFARTIYARGQDAAREGGPRDPRAFAKVGDCMTWAEYFLVPFGTDDYDLGGYADLQTVVSYFGEGVGHKDQDGDPLNPLATRSLAAESGFSTISVQDPLWANPDLCESNESPLTCEYRLSNPAFAVVMFGTNDVFYFDAATFDYNMRLLVLQTINADIVPILSTFPVRPEFPEKSAEFNRVIVKIALDYDLPLMNLVLALEDLPDQGVDVAEPIHLSKPADGAMGILTEDYLQYGYPLRNLLTLQTFEIVLRDLALLDADGDTASTSANTGAGASPGVGT
jgi:hypothetical protein